jgi:hypothetical protein
MKIPNKFCWTGLIPTPRKDTLGDIISDKHPDILWNPVFYPKHLLFSCSESMLQG